MAYALDQYNYLQAFNPAEDASPTGLLLSADGSKMYITGSVSDRIYQYTLGTAYDITSGTYDSVAFNPVEAQISGMCFSSDGMLFYTTGRQTDRVKQWTLSTAWDLSSAVFADDLYFGLGYDPNGLYVSPDGLEVYVKENGGFDINQYTLAVAHDLSSYTLQIFVTAMYYHDGFTLSDDGNHAYVAETDNIITQYDLGTAWDISTAVAGITRNMGARSYSIHFNKNGDKLYLSNLNTVTEYDGVVQKEASPLIEIDALAEGEIRRNKAFPLVEIDALAEARVRVASSEIFRFVQEIQGTQTKKSFRFIQEIEQPKTSTIITRTQA